MEQNGKILHEKLRCDMQNENLVHFGGNGDEVGDPESQVKTVEHNADLHGTDHIKRKEN